MTGLGTGPPQAADSETTVLPTGPPKPRKSRRPEDGSGAESPLHWFLL